MKAKYLGPAGTLDDRRNSGRVFRIGDTVTMSRAEFERLTADTSIRFEETSAEEPDEASEPEAGPVPAAAPAPEKRRPGRPRKQR